MKHQSFTHAIKKLTPKSYWRFNLEHHLSKGVHLNELFDFDIKDPDHQSGDIFILE
jgi:hypothetical protein